MAKEKAKLKPEVANKYNVVGDWSRCHYFGEYGEVDFNDLTLERAASLVYGGFPYLKEKPPLRKPLSTAELRSTSE